MPLMMHAPIEARNNSTEPCGFLEDQMAFRVSGAGEREIPKGHECIVGHAKPGSNT